MTYRFTVGNYDFYQDVWGDWNVSIIGQKPPSRGAYATAEAIARLKGISVHALPKGV